MSIQIPKYSDSVKFKNDIEALILSLSGELKIPYDSIPKVTHLFLELMSTVESQYEKLVHLINNKANSEKSELMNQILSLKEKNLKDYINSIN